MFDDFDDELDFMHERDEDLLFGCDASETCADCPHFNFCDGCGHFMEPAPSPRRAKKEKPQKCVQPTPEKPQKSQSDNWVVAAIGFGSVALIVAAYLLFYFL